MVFIALTLGLLVLLFLIMVALARAFEGHSVADLIDWKPTRSPEVDVAGGRLVIDPPPGLLDPDAAG